MSALHTSTPLEIKRRIVHHFGGQVDETTRQLVASVLPGFREDSLRSLLAMRAALSCRDREQLLLAANAMKGTSSNLGLERLAQFCEQMEALARERAFASAALELRLLAAEYRQAQQVLEDLLAAG